MIQTAPLLDEEDELEEELLLELDDELDDDDELDEELELEDELLDDDELVGHPVQIHKPKSNPLHPRFIQSIGVSRHPPELLELEELDDEDELLDDELLLELEVLGHVISGKLAASTE